MSDIPSLPPTTKQLDEEGGHAQVEACRASGLIGTTFCRARHLRPQRLHYWREHLGYSVRVNVPNSHPVAESSPPADGFVQVVARDPGPSKSTYVDIVVGGSVRGQK
jgi:hypothetical protein